MSALLFHQSCLLSCGLPCDPSCDMSPHFHSLSYCCLWVLCLGTLLRCLLIVLSTVSLDKNAASASLKNDDTNLLRSLSDINFRFCLNSASSLVCSLALRGKLMQKHCEHVYLKPHLVLTWSQSPLLPHTWHRCSYLQHRPDRWCSRLA